MVEAFGRRLLTSYTHLVDIQLEVGTEPCKEAHESMNNSELFTCPPQALHSLQGSRSVSAR